MRGEINEEYIDMDEKVYFVGSFQECMRQIKQSLMDYLK